MGKKLSVEIAGVCFKNPVTTASGTFGYGQPFEDFFDLSRLGAVTTKGVSVKPWKGNATPRMAETHGGMLNSIGLQNDGLALFIKTAIPYLRQFDTNIIVNICGHTLEEYVAAAEMLADADVDMLELNISCPNISEGGVAFGTCAATAAKVTEAVKKKAKQPLIVKLSPNVTDITEIAKAAESSGADAISLINTLLGMQIDIRRRKSMLANGYGGLSGPAIQPVALRMVHQTARAVGLPVIGMGGIATGEDAVAFLMAGATMVAVGTANFSNSHATTDVLDGIEAFMTDENIDDVRMLIGVV